MKGMVSGLPPKSIALLVMEIVNSASAQTDAKENLFEPSGVTSPTSPTTKQERLMPAHQSSQKVNSCIYGIILAISKQPGSIQPAKNIQRKDNDR